MIESLLGNSTAEKVLLFVVNYGQGHASGIARTFGLPKSQVRKQLLRFENGGILVAQDIGNQRLFTLNPRCLYRKELLALAQRVLDLLPETEINRYYRERRRPRRTSKRL